jgi:hypothetical protein
MKSLTLPFLASLMFVAMGLAAQGGNTFTGEIMDSACAKMGSHDSMMKSHPNMKTEKDCTLGCVKAGSQYVLYDASTKTVYELSDQNKPEQFAGQKVTVTGKLDKASNTITETNIKRAP